VVLEILISGTSIAN